MAWFSRGRLAGWAGLGWEGGDGDGARTSESPADQRRSMSGKVGRGLARVVVVVVVRVRRVRRVVVVLGRRMVWLVALGSLMGGL